jgi:hypothetical protein
MGSSSVRDEWLLGDGEWLIGAARRWRSGGRRVDLKNFAKERPPPPKIHSAGAAQIYTLHPSGCWRPPPIGAELERHQFEHVLASRAERIEKLQATNRRLTSSRKAIAAGEAAGSAIGTLVAIMSDAAIPIRGRLQAAENLLAYKTPPDIAEAAKLFLASVFTDPEQNIDHRLAATTALRRSEDVRIMPPIERPPPRTDVDSAEPVESLQDVIARRGAHADRMQREAIESGRFDPKTGRWSDSGNFSNSGNGSQRLGINASTSSAESLRTILIKHTAG